MDEGSKRWKGSGTEASAISNTAKNPQTKNIDEITYFIIKASIKECS